MGLDFSAFSDEQMQLAKQVAQAMMAGDASSESNGIRVVASAPGVAHLEMPVRDSMLNGHGICHGGMIYLLADTAFAYAANADNVSTLTSAASIDYFIPARKDDVLSAFARNEGVSGRIALYDVEILNQKGQRIALYRGRGYRLNRPVIEKE